MDTVTCTYCAGYGEIYAQTELGEVLHTCPMCKGRIQIPSSGPESFLHKKSAKEAMELAIKAMDEAILAANIEKQRFKAGIDV